VLAIDHRHSRTGLVNAIIAVAVYTYRSSRASRASALVVRDEPYRGGPCGGLSDLRILARHVFPNISATLFVMMTLRVAMITAAPGLPRPGAAPLRMGPCCRTAQRV
jgi:ABC-type dipeptide/oligopeptide/nickel transport system permease subunit